MPAVAISKAFLKSFEGQSRPVQQQIRKAIDQLGEESGVGALHREHYKVQRDARAQTIRVNEGLRAIVLKGEKGFVLIDVLPHDKADYWMANSRASENSVTGALEIIDVTTVQAAAEAFDRTGGAEVGVDLFHGASDKDFLGLGVSEEFIPLLRGATNRAHLDTLAALLPELQGEAAIWLAEGFSPEETFRYLCDSLESAQAAISAAVPVAPPTEAEATAGDLFAAAQNAASQSSFASFAEGDPALDDMLSQPWALWRTFLHRDQRATVAKRFSGPAKVSGGPGTGKTVVAIHRARFLAQQNPEAKILLTTFTTTLASDLQHLLRSLSPTGCEKVEVVNVDKVVSRILRESTSRSVATISDKDLDELFGHAQIEIGLAFSASFIRQEWEQVVLSAGVTSRAEYFAVTRPGRGVRLNRAQRAQVWEVIELVMGRLSKLGKRTFIQRAADAAEAAASGTRVRYDHIIVDEAQDLHPAHWKLLRALVPEQPNDMFLTADAQQRIYDRKVVLSRCGIKVIGRSSTLRLNYRSTAEIVRWAVGLLSDTPADDLDAGVADRRSYRSVLFGDEPTVAGFTALGAEIDSVAASVRALMNRPEMKADEIVVAARSRQATEMLVNRLAFAGVRAVVLGEDISGDPDAVHVATFHRLKGLEYRHVFLVDVSDGEIPLESILASEVDDPQQYRDDLAREQSLLFVAATRARDSLHVSYHGKPSRFLQRYVVT